MTSIQLSLQIKLSLLLKVPHRQQLLPPPPSCPATLPTAAFGFARPFLEDTACNGHQRTLMMPFLYTYSHRVGTSLIPTSSLHGHIHNYQTDCDSCLPKVKPAAFNPLASRCRTPRLALSTPRKMRHCSVTMVTSTFLYGNHHPELCNSLLCQDQVPAFTHTVRFAHAAQLWLCPLPQAPLFVKRLPAPL